jgi:hypothetical protein
MSLIGSNLPRQRLGWALRWNFGCPSEDRESIVLCPSLAILANLSVLECDSHPLYSVDLYRVSHQGPQAFSGVSPDNKNGFHPRAAVHEPIVHASAVAHTGGHFHFFRLFGCLHLIGDTGATGEFTLANIPRII